MNMQMAARITVSTVINFVGTKCRVDGFCGSAYIGEESVALLITEINNLAHMIFIRNYAASGVTLFLEENQAAHAEVADIYSELL